MASKVQIQIVTYNSRAHLEQLFRGIKTQEGVDFEVLIIDNNSEDDSVKWIQEHYPQARIIQNSENRGFGKAHNQGFEICDTSYVLVLNPDTELQSGFLLNCIDMIESDQQIASVGGVLYQQLPEPPLNPPLGKGGRWGGGVIDSLGLKMRINGQILDIGQNRPDTGKFGLIDACSEPKRTVNSRYSERFTGSERFTVFGITGACALYRLSALKQVKDEYGILDERFGLYSLKDDADLAWRLQRAGFKAKIAPKAFAFHARGTGKSDERKNRSDEVKQTSIRNHILMLKKNVKLYDWRLKIILGYELAKFIYVLLFERQNLKAYKSIRHPERSEGSRC